MYISMQPHMFITIKHRNSAVYIHCPFLPERRPSRFINGLAGTDAVGVLSFDGCLYRPVDGSFLAVAGRVNADLRVAGAALCGGNGFGVAVCVGVAWDDAVGCGGA